MGRAMGKVPQACHRPGTDTDQGEGPVSTWPWTSEPAGG